MEYEDTLDEAGRTYTLAPVQDVVEDWRLGIVVERPGGHGIEMQRGAATRLDRQQHRRDHPNPEAHSAWREPRPAGGVGDASSAA